jgi:hypothetical protein
VQADGAGRQLRIAQHIGEDVLGKHRAAGADQANLGHRAKPLNLTVTRGLDPRVSLQRPKMRGSSPRMTKYFEGIAWAETPVLAD